MPDDVRWQREARERLRARNHNFYPVSTWMIEVDLRRALDALDRVRAEIAKWDATQPEIRAIVTLIEEALDGS